MRAALCWLMLICLGAPAVGAGAATLYVEPLPLAQAQPALARARLDRKSGDVRAWFMGRETALLPGDDGCYYGAVAPDLKAKPGRYPLRVKADGKQVAAAEVEVVSKDYGERRITVSKKFMKLTPAQLKRYFKETARIKAVCNSFTPRRLWTDGFIRPLDSVVVGPFGRRSIINGKERSPHGGVDLRGKKGDPVMAPADGRAALVLDTYFGGLTILIDHGQGLITQYMHLSEALVKEGDKVRQGQIIGRVGSSGRVTGPHLHFGVRMGGARVDPLAWVAASRELSRRLQRAARPGRGG